MTYLEFHLVFVLPVLLVMLILSYRELKRLARPGWLSFLVLVLIAVIYTTPWDNYLVYKGIWYYSPDRVLGTIGWVPYEEYAFFVLQTLCTGLFYYWLARPSRWRDVLLPALPAFRSRYVVLGLVAMILASVVGLGYEPTLYLSLILVWGLPVVLLHWVVGGKSLVFYGRRNWLVIMLASLYFWLADAYAIDKEIWLISERYTTGFKIFSLPIEEAVFFFMTNVLVVQGLCLFLDPYMQTTIAQVWQRWRGRMVLKAKPEETLS